MWRGGDAVNLSIGQGDLLATPLQVATSVAAVANGGTVWRPHVAAATVRSDGRIDPMPTSRLGRLDVSRRAIEELLALFPEFPEIGRVELGKWYMDESLLDAVLGGVELAGLEVS